MPWIRVSATVSSHSRRKLVLLLQAGENPPFEGIVLSIADTVLDLSLMAGHVRPRGQEHEAIMLAEGPHFGIELGIEPVGLLHRRAKIIKDQPPGRSAKLAEGILEAAEKLVGGLAVDDLAVGLARVGQHDAEEMGLAALAVATNDPGTCAEVDLSLLTRPAFEAAKWQFARRRQLADEAPDAVVGTGEAVLGDQVLVDALGAEPEVALGLRSHRARARTRSCDRGGGRFSPGPKGPVTDRCLSPAQKQPSRRAQWLVLAPSQLRSSRRAQWLVLAPPQLRSSRRAQWLVLPRLSAG